MKIYTKKGDTGKTGIIGKSQVSKDDIRIQAYGTIDELNAILGILNHKVVDEIKKEIPNIQALLFEIGSELASLDVKNNITEDDVHYLEQLIDNSEDNLDSLTSFILPGGSKGSSWLHLARTVTRRAERKIISFQKTNKINSQVIPFINRLSDLFFSWSRLNNQINGVNDIEWKSRK